MSKSAIKLWQIDPVRGEIPRILYDMSSLDAITKQLPDGLYTTFRTYDDRTRVIDLKSHLSRLYDPLLDANVKAQIEKNALRQTLGKVLANIDSGEVRVRLVMTLSSDLGVVYIAVEPLHFLASSVYERGVRVITVAQLGREKPTLKNTAFIGQSQDERAHLEQEHIFEGLLVRQNRILEGMTSNFFYVKGSILFTAHRGILLGVTRKMVLDVARREGIEIGYRSLNLNRIVNIDEAFITSSSRGIVPVVNIDGVLVGSGHPGSITQRLMRSYDTAVLHYAEQI